MDENSWNLKAVKTDKERIIALESTIAKLKATPPEAKKNERTRSNNNPNQWAWKKIPPKAREVKTIKRGTPIKTYLWCPKHEAWYIHTTEACEKNIANDITVEPPATAATNVLKAEVPIHRTDLQHHHTTRTALLHNPVLSICESRNPSVRGELHRIRHVGIRYQPYNHGPPRPRSEPSHTGYRQLPYTVDNCCTRTLMFDIKDFIPSTLQDVQNKVVSGFVAETSTPITKTGTIRWSIMEDTDTTQQIQVPNSYFIPAGTTRLLSPQHWAQESTDTYPFPHGTRSITTAESVVLEWDQNNFQRKFRSIQLATTLEPFVPSPGTS
jgi:hypothetical protein